MTGCGEDLEQTDDFAARNMVFRPPPPWSIPQLALVRDEPRGWGYATWSPPTGLAYGRVDRTAGRGFHEFKQHVRNLQRALDELGTGALLLLAGGVRDQDGGALDGSAIDIIHDLEEAGVPLDDVLCRSRDQIIGGLAPLAPGSAAQVELVLAVHRATGVSFSHDDTAPALAVGLLVTVAGMPLPPGTRPELHAAVAGYTSGARTSRADYLTAAEVAAQYGISLSSAYDLARYIPSWKPPCFGLKYRRSDIEEFIARYQRDPVAGRRGRKSGTRRARRGRSNEVAPGWTAEALKREAGI